MGNRGGKAVYVGDMVLSNVSTSGICYLSEKEVKEGMWEGGLGSAYEQCFNTVLRHLNSVLKKMASTKRLLFFIVIQILSQNSDMTRRCAQRGLFSCRPS